MRQSIRGYTDALIEQSRGAGELAQIASELSAVHRLLGDSPDLAFALSDGGVPIAARRGVVTDLLEPRVAAPTLQLLLFAMASDRASELRDNTFLLAARVDAAARGLVPVGEPVLGLKAAEERLDGFATCVLQQVSSTAAVGEIEDEMFRFAQTVKGSEPLAVALGGRDVPPAARRALVEDLLKARANPATTGMAAYATQVGRPRDYLELLHFLVERLAEEGHRRVAEVRSAVDLDDAERGRLGSALSLVTGRAVEIRVSVDSSLLGGFVATIGDTVVDGSTRHRLDLLKERFDMPEAQITLGGRS